MRKALLASILLAAVSILADPILSQQAFAPGGDPSRESSFSVHNLNPAHALTLGAGAKVGILDHSFGLDAHPGLYAGSSNFLTGEWGESLRTRSHHGYWMALALHEMAPETEIFALNTYTPDESERVQAMVEAMDWAVEQELDAITYGGGEGFSPEARAILDPAVERTVAAGVAVVFLHYPHPENILPAGMGPRSPEDGREPDLNIFHHDCSLVFGSTQVSCFNGDDDRIQDELPFLSLGSTAPVTAGFVALLRSLDPGLTPVRIKEILMASSHPAAFDGRTGARVPDMGEAVGKVAGLMARR